MATGAHVIFPAVPRADKMHFCFVEIVAPHGPVFADDGDHLGDDLSLARWPALVGAFVLIGKQLVT